MIQQVDQLSLSFDKILTLVKQLPKQEQNKLREELDKNLSQNQEEDLLSVFDRIGKNAQGKGLTEEILEELLVDES
ncbi:hypothetical protein ACN4EE_05835 [Geminocystis sp. CENA526]|uniref:hypothetical protein n=1 Tax=Geminocystis sp. CENA526 TaxID=1355871 RepID=UPI003D6E9C6C